MSVGHYVTPNLSDELRFLMVEHCAGDIQGYIENNYMASNFIETLYKLTLMTFHALLLLDAMLGGYSHKDLGTRNVLYTWDPYGSADKV